MAEARVEFVGAIRRPWPEMSRSIDIEPGISVKRLLEELGYRPTEISHLTVYINQKKVKRSAGVQAGDHVTILLIVGGG